MNDEKPKKCPTCNGRGYFHCECWPGDCICGADDEDCWDCGGTGWIDPAWLELDWEEPAQ